MTDLTRALDDLNSVEKFYDKLTATLRERGIDFDVMNHHDDELVEILDIGTAEEIVEELGIPTRMLEIHDDYAIVRLSALDSV